VGVGVVRAGVRAGRRRVDRSVSRLNLTTLGWFGSSFHNDDAAAGAAEIIQMRAGERSARRFRATYRPDSCGVPASPRSSVSTRSAPWYIWFVAGVSSSETDSYAAAARIPP